MSSSLVIAAIPREDDPIMEISSEKVPHLTILYLGEAEGKPYDKIAGFVAHASGMMLSRFGLDVDRRGELGEDKADVLFFQDNWELPRLREFRSQLLKDNNIKKAYDSVEQFPIWTPHLTLGYPDSPAKPTKERIYWVQFDRIAVWQGDYEGVEFVLKNDYAMEVAMSDTAAQGRQFLSHYGVKGMRWGVRRNREATSATAEGIVNAGLSGKTKVKAKGGQAQEATPDAIKAAVQKQKLKKSGAAALSNQELRELSERMRLEVEVKRLDQETASAGRKFVKKAVGQNVTRVGQQEVAGAVDRAVREAKNRK
jgi:2'-5' RNA ligase